MVLTRERHISLNAAARLVPTGNLDENGRDPGVHPATIHRWARQGCRGHLLETTLVGKRRLTSEPALRRFLDALNSNQRTSLLVEPQADPERVAEAEVFLAREGFDRDASGSRPRSQTSKAGGAS